MDGNYVKDEDDVITTNPNTNVISCKDTLGHALPLTRDTVSNTDDFEHDTATITDAQCIVDESTIMHLNILQANISVMFLYTHIVSCFTIPPSLYVPVMTLIPPLRTSHSKKKQKKDIRSFLRRIGKLPADHIISHSSSPSIKYATTNSHTPVQTLSSPSAKIPPHFNTKIIATDIQPPLLTPTPSMTPPTPNAHKTPPQKFPNNPTDITIQLNRWIRYIKSMLSPHSPTNPTLPSTIALTNSRRQKILICTLCQQITDLQHTLSTRKNISASSFYSRFMSTLYTKLHTHYPDTTSTICIEDLLNILGSINVESLI
mmetsp:Transcript_35178/g.43054  ORF Transcript_35178/g.43054 Transcript_35178/m.43054 type:complete len:316 (+) Transcript_35178:1239-2186(+)